MVCVLGMCGFGNVDFYVVYLGDRCAGARSSMLVGD